jgi:hypothetical protein
MQSDVKKFSSSQMRQIDDLRKNRDIRANSTGGNGETQGILKKPASNGTSQPKREIAPLRNSDTSGM